MTRCTYALIDPLTKRVRYIGASGNPYKRVKEHGSADKYVRDTSKREWFLSLRAKKLWPDVAVLEVVNGPNWREREKDWIKFYLSIGADLFNMANGDNPERFWKFQREHRKRVLQEREEAKAQRIKEAECYRLRSLAIDWLKRFGFTALAECDMSLVDKFAIAEELLSARNTSHDLHVQPFYPVTITNI